MFGFDPRDKYEVPHGFREPAGTGAPDYRMRATWAWHPTYAPCTAWPQGFGPVPALPERPADVFYIHPTTHRGIGAEWNAGWDDAAANAIADSWPLRHQVSAFRGCGRIFAPRYRQAHLRCFYVEGPDAEAALEFAFADVRAAFAHYLAHEDEGRPLILAAHSQGSYHCARLLADFFDGTALAERLVVAYVPGMRLATGMFTQLEPAYGPDAIGGYAMWMTVTEGHYPEYYRDHFIGNPVVNPITWWPDQEEFSAYAEHHGILNRNLRMKYRGAISARPHDGLLWIKPLRVPLGSLLRVQDWHIADYNLYWSNIQRNAEHRLAQWCAAHP
jgi:hypothetical protein